MPDDYSQRKELTDYADHFANRVGAGTGVFTLGSPRQIEFGLKVNF
jgi:hypothetical protein